VSQRSTIGSYFTMPTGAFGADEPVSALRSYIVRDNAQHLIDVSGQYRVSWCADLGSDGLLHDSGLFPLTPSYCFWTFPVTVSEINRPHHFDIRVAVKLDAAGSATVLAALGPENAPHEVMAGENPRQWFRTIATHTSTSVGWAIDEQWEFDTIDLSYWSAKKTVGITENGATQNSEIVLARLEVLLLGTTSELESYVLGVQLREFV
jgi:hypothetical protein